MPIFISVNNPITGLKSTSINLLNIEMEEITVALCSEEICFCIMALMYWAYVRPKPPEKIINKVIVRYEGFNPTITKPKNVEIILNNI